MSIRSMTGFARVRKPHGEGEMIASIKSVNHRGLDVHFHMPPELDQFENSLRSAVKRKVLRGHVQIQIRFTGARNLEPAVLNRALLETYISTFRRAATTHDLPGAPDLNAAFRLPGMFEPVDPEPDPEMEARLLAAAEEALDILNEFREREGAETGEEMRERATRIRDWAASMEGLRDQALPRFQARLTERLRELLSGAGLEPQRLVQEAAILADRSDISEELTRLKIHAVQLGDLLSGGGEVGKKLDFLLQEMQREANTILSKSSGAGEIGLAITDLGLKIKAEIEKIREQSLNVE
jgi:uncharacterized protein (TIGR00255 family)